MPSSRPRSGEPVSTAACQPSNRVRSTSPSSDGWRARLRGPRAARRTADSRRQDYRRARVRGADSELGLVRPWSSTAAALRLMRLRRRTARRPIALRARCAFVACRTHGMPVTILAAMISVRSSARLDARPRGLDAKALPQRRVVLTPAAGTRSSRGRVRARYPRRSSPPRSRTSPTRTSDRGTRAPSAASCGQPGPQQHARRHVLLQRRLAASPAIAAPMQALARQIQRHRDLRPLRMRMHAHARPLRRHVRPEARVSRRRSTMASFSFSAPKCVCVMDGC